LGRKGLRKEVDHTGYKGRWIKTKGSQGKIQVASEKCIADLGRRKKKKKPNPEDGDWKKIIDHRYPALIKITYLHLGSNKIGGTGF
jgi:hypothetical protein